MSLTSSSLICAFPDQSLPEHLPKFTTLRILFTRFLDFSAVPRRSFFQYLRYFTSTSMEREKLDEFLSLEGAVCDTLSCGWLPFDKILQDELHEYCYKVRR